MRDGRLAWPGCAEYEYVSRDNPEPSPFLRSSAPPLRIPSCVFDFDFDFRTSGDHHLPLSASSASASSAAFSFLFSVLNFSFSFAVRSWVITRRFGLRVRIRIRIKVRRRRGIYTFGGQRTDHGSRITDQARLGLRRQRVNEPARKAGS